LSALPALAVDVLIVQSGNGPAYAESIRGFKEVYRGTTQTILLSDYAEVDLVRLVKEEQPRLVLAVGDPAFAKAKKLRQIPVVTLLALSFGLQKPPVGNMHGVSVLASPARYMELFKKMGAKRVGVLYDPARTGAYLKQARQEAENAGIRLMTREVVDPRDVMAVLEQMDWVVDALWMLPDTTAVTSVTLEAFFNFSIKHQLPLVTFSGQYLSKGAAASIDHDRTDMGRQAGEMATVLLDGAASAGAAGPRKTTVSTNESVLRKLSKQIPNAD